MNISRILGRVAGAVGRGLLAGFVGTLAITASQTLEMKISGREASATPAEAAGKVLGVEPRDEAGKERFSQIAHFGYGTALGALRGVLGALGIKGPLASLLHGLAVQGAAMVMLPALKVAPPVSEWGAQQIAIESAHHAVYAAATGAAFDALDAKG